LPAVRTEQCCAWLCHIGADSVIDWCAPLQCSIHVPSSLIIQTRELRAIIVDMSSPDSDVTPIQNISHCLTISRLHLSMPLSSPPCKIQPICCHTCSPLAFRWFSAEMHWSKQNKTPASPDEKRAQWKVHTLNMRPWYVVTERDTRYLNSPWSFLK
jgi:hypothetical protein